MENSPFPQAASVPASPKAPGAAAAPKAEAVPPPTAVPATAAAPAKTLRRTASPAGKVSKTPPRTAARRIAKTPAKAPAKPPVKASTKPATKATAKLPAKARRKSATNVPAKAAKRSVPAKVKPTAEAPKKKHAHDGADKKGKTQKAKLIRDSFTMPEPEYALFAAVKKRCLAKGLAVTKSEVLRAAIKGFAAENDTAVLKALRGLEVLKKGRPPKVRK